MKTSSAETKFVSTYYAIKQGSHCRLYVAKIYIWKMLTVGWVEDRLLLRIFNNTKEVNMQEWFDTNFIDCVLSVELNVKNKAFFGLERTSLGSGSVFVS